MYDKVMKDGKSMMQLKKEFGGAMEMSHMKKSPMDKSPMDKSPMDKSPMNEAHGGAMDKAHDGAMEMSHMKLTQDAAMKLTSAMKKKLKMVKGPDGNLVPEYAVDGKGPGDLKK